MHALRHAGIDKISIVLPYFAVNYNAFGIAVDDCFIYSKKNSPH
jgi:hypothetical protein